jgi:hypothetical protein
MHISSSPFTTQLSPFIIPFVAYLIPNSVAVSAQWEVVHHAPSLGRRSPLPIFSLLSKFAQMDRPNSVTTTTTTTYFDNKRNTREGVF